MIQLNFPECLKNRKLLLLYQVAVLVFSLGHSTLHATSELQAVNDLQEAGEYLTALSLIDNLLSTRPCDPDLLFQQARIYEVTGEINAAIAVYQILIDHFPHLPEPYNNTAAIYTDRGDIEEAKALLLRGLSTNSTYLNLYKNLSTIHIAKAAEAYRRALSLDQNEISSTESKRLTPVLVTTDQLIHGVHKSVDTIPILCKPMDP